MKDQGHDDNVFVHWTELKNYKVGQIVKFTAFFNGEGRLQGKDLKSGIKSTSSPAPLRAMGVSNLSKLATSMSRLLKRSKLDEAGGVIGDFLGTIESAGANFAFIICDELEEQGHGKVFVLRDELKAYKVGQTVRFTAYLTSQGRCQGKALRSGLKEDTELGQFHGVIENAGAKFAFIICEELEEQGHGKVFVIRDELKAYKVGQTVRFTACKDEQGRLRGKDLRSGIKDSMVPGLRASARPAPPMLRKTTGLTALTRASLPVLRKTIGLKRSGASTRPAQLVAPKQEEYF